MPSQKTALAHEHIRMLDRCFDRFKAADEETREEIIEDAADYIQNTWNDDAEFDRDAVISVYELPSKLNHSKYF